MKLLIQYLQIVSVAILLSTKIQAQSSMINDSSNFIVFEFAKPSFKNGSEGIKFLTGVYDLSFGTNPKNGIQFIADIPVAHAGVEYDYGDSDTSIGNIYIGGRFGKKENTVNGEIGVMLPTSNDDNFLSSYVGILAFQDRFEKFAPDTWGLNVKARIDDTFSNKSVFYRLYAGLLYFRTSNDEIDINSYYLDYSAQLGYSSDDNVTLRASIYGRTGLNDDAKYEVYDDETGNISYDASSFLMGISASYRTNNFEPGVGVKFPLDDPFKEVVSSVFHLTLQFHLN